MSRSSDLLARQQSNLAAARAVPFIEDTIGGTLSDEGFRRYLVIEEAFVLTAVKVLGWWSPNPRRSTTRSTT